MARRDLAGRDDRRLAAATLAVLEEHGTPVALRRSAYALLATRPVPAALPRLTLRLKYEKDYPANVDLARALLRLGSGAGLEALRGILLAADDAAPDAAAARAAAARALTELPPRGGWEPGADFATDWQRLLEVREHWLAERELPGAAPAADVAPGAVAETWRTVARLASGPLRPVDDARFVLARLPADLVLPVLLEAAHERDLYVREHVLQVLSWLGPTVGRWATRRGRDVVAELVPLLGEPSSRARTLEALGACGLPEAAPELLRWLRDGGRDEATAAADALLRCADRAAAEEALRSAAERSLTPAARWSLALLAADVGPTEEEPSPPPDLDPAEVRRREEWRAERALRARRD